MPESEHSFLLSNTPTTEHRITIEEDTAVLSTTTRFVLGASDIYMLTQFLQAVKVDKKTVVLYRDDNWQLQYDPQNGELDKFSMTRRANDRTISMALSTAYRLLDALTGKTERLVKE